MNERDRYTIILIGGALSLILSGTVCAGGLWLLVHGGSEGLANLLFGGIIGTGAFGGGALLATLGLQRQGPGPGNTTVTVPQEPPGAPVTVQTGDGPSPTPLAGNAPAA